ncbi:glycerol-3-phosphate dehydrogenase/oxidase, partial [Saprospiraceae bacterium]|nr:glycerol-3-phosphate dehydrogenase/oxidase [Saprospiraceae bacterium]
THYDLVIIGGGITGAGIALDAALRGLKVVLIEKNDFASGTSSKSTKLIHGGLRYLKQFEIGLVRETGLERAVAHDNACHLVHPENMLLPIVEDGTFSMFTAGIAIRVYDILADVDKNHRRKKLSLEEVKETAPLLRQDILKSGIVYAEYRTDDARLTIEIVKAARRQSAEAINYMEVTGFQYDKKKVSGIICHDHIMNAKVEITGSVIVSSTGPWVDELRQIDFAKTKTNLHLTKGVHIVVDKKDLPITDSIYFDAFDGRMLFAIPRGEIVYIGTTDTNFKGDQDDLHCTKEDAQYILDAVNNMFSIEPLTIDHIQSTWTGLRPLIQQEGKGPSELSRKEEIFTSDTGLISIAGGKLTGYRKMAQRVLDIVIDKLPGDYTDCKTKHFKIHNNPFNEYKDYTAAIATLEKKYSQDKMLKKHIKYLVTTYGNDAQMIFDQYTDKLKKNKESSSKKLLVEAQLEYSIQYELVSEVMDFIDRRAGWLFFHIADAKEYLEFVAQKLAEHLGKNKSWVDYQIAEAKERIDRNSLAKIKTGG